MKEYEYSFKVKSLEPYIKYCNENNFEKTEESSQVRVLYKNENKILARITTTKINEVVKTVIDFKDEDDTNKILKVSRETIPLEIEDKDKEAIISILDILGYIKHKELIRKRSIYKKDKVTFEIDDYTSPDKMYVVAIEGDKKQVDEIYSEVRKNIIQ